MLQPHWTTLDFDFAKRTTVNSALTADIYKEILSFRRQGMAFTYELLGLNHEPRAVESILPTTSNQAQTQVDYFPNPYQHMNSWTQQEQDEAIAKYQNQQWGRQEEEEAVANILDYLIRDETIEPQQEPQQVIMVQKKT
ncbi:hypothetical protein OS493_018107 [Desmophyllum pertusum]|uniref:Uncharacterized protein n=1 Tax=Desmophyllum pertusum TaxID=174260 RepID=A0A9W9YNK1_9CNID|nr:hypothetical protein OS493_018107 [Desmophyllum pertusum]